jgi:hypothetical protein
VKATTNSAIGPTSARSYYELQMEMAALDASIQRRKPGAEVPVLPPGQVPRNPNYAWNTGDRAPEPPVGDDDG